MGRNCTVETRGDTLRRPRFRGCLSGYVRELLIYAGWKLYRALA